MKVLIMYDISEDRRRTKVEKLLASYGYRVNYSVFELDIKKRDYRKLIDKLRQISNPQDNIRVYILNEEVIKKSFCLHTSQGVFRNEELYF